MGHTKNDDEIEIDLREVFFALRKKIWLIIAAMLAGVVIAGLYTQVLVTPIYSAKSIMLVLTKETTLSSLADLQIGSQLTKDYSILITSRPVLEEVIKNLNLDISYKTLKENIEIDNPEDTRILEISVTNSDAETAKEIVDEVAEVSSEFIGEQMEVVPPKIIEKGEVPDVQTSPSMKKNIAIGAVAGAVLSAGVVILLTILNDTVKSEEDIERYLRIPTLASIPDRKDYITDKKKKKRRRRRKRRRRSK